MAEISLVVALFGLAVAALSLGWQVAAWVFDGRRVRLTLLHGVMGAGSVATAKVGRGGRPHDFARMRDQGYHGDEVIGVSVTNVGRAPVRIDAYSVVLTKGGMSLSPLADAIGPTLPFRLPPGETETWYGRAQDARALISSVRGIGRDVGSGVYMSIQLGTGDVKRTRYQIKV